MSTDTDNSWPTWSTSETFRPEIYRCTWPRRRSRIFSKGGLKKKILKENCLLIHVSTCVHIKTRQTCNSLSLSLSLSFPFQEDCLLFFALFYYSLLFLKFEGGVATSSSANACWTIYLWFKKPTKSLNKFEEQWVFDKRFFFIIW